MIFENIVVARKEDCSRLSEALIVILQESRFKIPYTEYSENKPACEMAKRLFSIEQEAKQALETIQQFIVEPDAMSLRESKIKEE